MAGILTAVKRSRGRNIMASRKTQLELRFHLIRYRPYLDVDVLCIFQSKGDENGEDQKFGDEVRQDNFKLGYGRGRGRRCRAGVALRAARGGGRCHRRRHCGAQAGKASQAKPKLKRKLAARTRTKSAAAKSAKKKASAKVAAAKKTSAKRKK